MYKKENREYHLKNLTPEVMKSLESTKSKVTKDENVLHLEIIEVILVQCNITNNDYHHDSRVFYTSFPNESFGQLLDIS